MDCSECKKKNKDFVNDLLEPAEVIAFCNHVRSCPSCMEELAIEFLIVEGIKRLDSATSFDLNKELDLKLNTMYRKAVNYKKLRTLAIILTIIFGLLLGIVLSGLFGY